MTDRAQTYQDWKKYLLSDDTYQQHPELWDKLCAYLEQEQTPLPTYDPLYDHERIASLLQTYAFPAQWEAYDRRLMALCRHFWADTKAMSSIFWKKSIFLHFWPFLTLRQNREQVVFEGMLKILKDNGFEDAFLWDALTETDLCFNYDTSELYPAGYYVLRLTDAMLAKLKPAQAWTRWALFPMLLKNDEKLLNKYLKHFIFIQSSGGDFPGNFLAGQQYLEMLLAHNAKQYEIFAASFINPIDRLDQPDQLREVFRLLLQYLPGKYEEKFYPFAKQYLEQLRQTFSAQQYLALDWDHDARNYNLYINRAFAALIAHEPRETVLPYLQQYFRDMPMAYSQLVKFQYDQIGAACIPIILEFLPKKYQIWDSAHRSLFEILAKEPHEAYYPVLWKNLSHRSSPVRMLISRHIGKVIGAAAIPQASALLKHKSKDTRFSAAMILSIIRTEAAQRSLYEALLLEKDDAVRDQILSGLGSSYLPPSTREGIAAAVQQAAQRGKLSKPIVTWLAPETELPPLPWAEGSSALDAETLRFLFYRMTRVSTTGIDPEAAPIIQLSKRAPETVPFASNILERFLASKMESQDRWVLSLSSIYGDKTVVNRLAEMVDVWTNNKRSQLGVWTVEAMALNGSDEALRLIEQFSRKYRSKYRNVGAAAQFALAVAAEREGLSFFELTDRLIPYFGFQGIYLPFDINGAPYRAFVAMDLNLNYLDEQNRLSKSLPAAASAEQKLTFKQLGTEIALTIKEQVERLTQYLIIQRKWSTAQWSTFFLKNPVLFAHATRLVWFAYDHQFNRLFAFQCLENQDLIDLQGKKIVLPIDGFIGIAHPLDLTPEALAAWQIQLKQRKAKPLFEQLARPVRHLPAEDQQVKFSKAFKGIKHPAGGFVSYLEKKGWVRGEIGDAGWINSFYKHFPELGITAVLTQSGMVVIGWYTDGEAELDTLSFLRYGSIGFPGIEHGDPYTEQDTRLVPFGEVPPVVYSEVLGELDYFRGQPKIKRK